MLLYTHWVAALSTENLRQTAALDAKNSEMKKELESIESGEGKQSMVHASLSSIDKLCGQKRGRSAISDSNEPYAPLSVTF